MAKVSKYEQERDERQRQINEQYRTAAGRQRALREKRGGKG